MRDRYRLDGVLLLDRFYRGRVTFLEEGYNALLARKPYTSRDRGLLVSLVRGTVKTRPHLEEILRFYLPRWEKLPLTVQNILRCALFQLLFHSGIPTFAVVNEWVEVTKKLGQGVFVALVNAVLHKIGNKRDEYREMALGWGIVLPEWLEKEWEELFPQEKEMMKRSLVLPPETYLRVNTLSIGREELAARLVRRGILTEIIPFLPFALRVRADSSVLFELPEWEEGLFYPQDLGSQMAVEMFRPFPGERVFDLCCGVGGKSTAFAQLMNDTGEIIAWDYNPDKIRTLRQLVARMKMQSIRPAVVDVLNPPEDFWESADRVFLDAPCSGLGTVRRHPEVLERITREMVRGLAEKQFNLLMSASRLVKRGGIILYCVCTLTEEETEGVVCRFEVERGKVFTRVSPPDSFFAGGKRDLGFFLLPHWENNDGFFVTIWKKKEAE